MRVLITGGAGFIGSHLAERMLADGHSVVVVDDLSTGRRDNLADIRQHPSFEFVRASVRDQATMTPLVDRCDAIFHLAAAVGVQLIVDEPVHTIETNIHGSEVMLRLAGTFNRRILVASTSEVYGKSTRVPFREDDDVTFGSTRFTRWSYACSKMVDEFLALAYHDQYGLPAVVARLFNTVGPRQTGKYGMVVPRFVRRALRGEPLDVYGTGEQSRCFTHVADVVEALIALLPCDAAVGQVVNVGYTEPISIRQLAELIVNLTGSRSPIRTLDYQQAYGREFDDMMIRQPDVSRLRELTGTMPQTPLETTLRDVIEYEQRRL